MLVRCCWEGNAPNWEHVPVLPPMQARTRNQKVQNEKGVRSFHTLVVQVETLPSRLPELRLPRPAGILWKELKWQSSQFPSFLAKINLTG